MPILAIISNALMVLAYFFNPDLRKQQEKEKVWAIFNDLEEKLAQAMADKDTYAIDRIRHWLQQMRDKYSYIKDGK